MFERAAGSTAPCSWRLKKGEEGARLDDWRRTARAEY